MHALSTYSLTGLSPVESSWTNPHHLEAGAQAEVDGLRGLLSPSNPLFTFGLILAVTVGLVGVSGSVRLGKSRASASLDKA